MPVVARITGTAEGCVTPHDGNYLVEWDPDTEFQTLAVNSSPYIAEAKVFESPTQLVKEWRAISRYQPRRPDGKPNRPLTALNLEIRKAPNGNHN